MGPETTSKFYLEVIFGCQKINTDNRPSILIQSVPIPYSLEREEILEGRCGKETLTVLIKAADNLVKGGADFIVMPCNSLHIFIDELRRSVNVPIVSIVDAVVRFLVDRKIDRIGILSTPITKRAKLYDAPLAERGIICEFPDDYEQKKVNEVILNLVNGVRETTDRETMVDILKSFEDKGVKNVLLACTDLQLAVPKTELQIFDSMNILAQATVKELLSSEKVYEIGVKK